ncbi:acyl-CoA thioesterase II [Comamonas sp. NLF-1-9]|uniref:acyl-CoA thioesterase n=1 Tax=Comamonas sp. NLF-1-9 TaxID=2853163 RepID=UPI001C460834|nr:thioesterase family protein [Comamonas sp. NLF-1-9]QXL83531.1 thioesterase family protein [Comamonas sp. NLF-1-9]
MNPSLHPLDDALALTAAGADTFTGRTTATYWNMVGPFGGVTAATLLQAVMQHPARLGEPLSLTVNYAGAVGEGPFEIRATAVRTTRSTQHWWLQLVQPDKDGQAQVMTTATAITALRRETWSASDLPMPEAPAPEACTQVEQPIPVQWINRYAMRPVSGMPPRQWDGAERDSLTRLWVRDAPERALDFAALAALCDVFYPRIWRRRALQVPAGTVSMTVYFHAGSALLAETGSGWLLAQARGQEYRGGFFDQTAQLWNQAGQMLATTQQIVYYKE